MIIAGVFIALTAIKFIANYYSKGLVPQFEKGGLGEIFLGYSVISQNSLQNRNMSTFKSHSTFPKEKNLQMRLYPNVCFCCRKSFKKPISEEPRLCPQCGGAMTRLSRKFSAPASNDLTQWKKVQFLVNHGFLFQSVYDNADGGSNIRYPATLEEAKVFVVAFKTQAVNK